jgi:hypothetical protein
MPAERVKHPAFSTQATHMGACLACQQVRARRITCQQHCAQITKSKHMNDATANTLHADQMQRASALYVCANHATSYQHTSTCRHQLHSILMLLAGKSLMRVPTPPIKATCKSITEAPCLLTQQRRQQTLRKLAPQLLCPLTW